MWVLFSLEMQNVCNVFQFDDDRMIMNEKLIYLLFDLGLSANYTGFFYIITAAEIAIKEQQSLTMVTKWLYPQVAKQYKTSWKAVERNIRTCIEIIWSRNPYKLQQLANFPLDTKPTVAQFISILVYYIKFVDC